MSEEINNSIETIPEHIAIIMDGNGRWARERGQGRLFGHQAGVQSVVRIVKESARIGVRYLTLYTFSTENWKRSVEEVQGLMKLLVLSMQALGTELIKEGVRVQVIGDIPALPQEVQDTLQDLIDRSADNDKITVVLALNYGSRQEICVATKAIAEKVQNNELALDDVTEETISQHLLGNSS